MVNWIMKNLRVRSRKHAVSLCDALLNDKLIVPVTTTADVTKFGDSSTVLYKFSETLSSVSDSSLLPSESQKLDRVSVKNFTFLRVLGVGGFGSVYLAQKKDDERLYAIKAIRKSRFRNQKEIESLILESEVLRNDHPYLLHLYWAFTSKDFIYLGVLMLSLPLSLSSFFSRSFTLSSLSFLCFHLSFLVSFGLYGWRRSLSSSPKPQNRSLSLSLTYFLFFSLLFVLTLLQRLFKRDSEVYGCANPLRAGTPACVWHHLP